MLWLRRPSQCHHPRGFQNKTGSAVFYGLNNSGLVLMSGVDTAKLKCVCMDVASYSSSCINLTFMMGLLFSIWC